MSDNQPSALRFRGHVVIGGLLECQSGLHIGGNRDALSLGGSDLPVARDPSTQQPLIPGSSLKGRLRGLLEMLRGRVRFERGDAPARDERDAIDLLFGMKGGGGKCGPTRLIVRDGVAASGHGREGGTADWWQALDTDGLGTEVKSEAALNRVTAAAQVRQVERVVAGSRFDIEFVLNLYDFWEDEERLIADLLVALALLEDSYLGGHGSRGYGRVRISLHEKIGVVSAHDYEQGGRKSAPAGELKGLDAIDGAAWVAFAKEQLRANG